MSKFIFGASDDFAQALLDASAITEPLDSIKRIVIDLHAGEPAKILIEKYADDKHLAAGITAAITITEET